jgi:hypothetical protein
VIIENQYGPIDHGHLGQILTYAGGTKPTTVVWVAEEFREEHRAALEWLNTHTDPSIRFFGVRLAAVTLDGAPGGLIAPFLELVVKPNEWEKVAVAAAAAGTTGSTTARQELYREFWSQIETLAKQRGWTNASAPAQNWWNMSTGLSGAVWGVSFAMFGGGLSFTSRTRTRTSTWRDGRTAPQESRANRGFWRRTDLRRVAE